MWPYFKREQQILSGKSYTNKQKLALYIIDTWLPCLGIFVFLLPKSLNDFAFQSFYFECQWGRFFQKNVLRTELIIYLFSLGTYLCWWTISLRVYHPPSRHRLLDIFIMEIYSY